MGDVLARGREEEANPSDGKTIKPYADNSVEGGLIKIVTLLITKPWVMRTMMHSLKGLVGKYHYTPINSMNLEATHRQTLKNTGIP